MSSPRASGKRRAGKVLVCGCGAFSVFSLPRIILQLLHHCADDVQVVLSRAAAGMVSPYAVEVASRNTVFVEMDDVGGDVFVPHIELGRDIDMIIVFPATVNLLGKVANGIADELISAIVMATEAPVLFVPVSNPAMLEHPATRRNVTRLKEDGYIVLAPIPGPEVATREDMDLLGDSFPIPTLMMQMQAVLGARDRGRVRRDEPGT